MDTNELIRLLDNRNRQLADAIDRHRDCSIVITTLDHLFQEYLDLYNQVFHNSECSGPDIDHG